MGDYVHVWSAVMNCALLLDVELMNVAHRCLIFVLNILDIGYFNLSGTDNQ